ncbi:hypothetical protein BGZ49_000939 [Haplosporangium sp. Z 27]|nr:hypothetical protein BGZ49_000939 [Haplosporangium sp. Z 27]
MESCRITQNNFYSMEMLLTKWFVDLQEQQVPVTLTWIQWQGFAVHRMLSGLSQEPLPPLKFSNGWLEGFKNRNKHYLMGGKTYSEMNLEDESAELSRLRQLLPRYTKDHIYFCDVTSIFALPACVLRHRGKACQLLSKKQQTNSGCKRGPGISLVLLCNASGTVKREPVLLDRNKQISTGQRRIPFATWLDAFNKELDHDVLLLVSATIWEQIRDRLQGLTLTRVHIEAVPRQLNAWLPMRAGIAREFKAYVNAINFEWTLFLRDSLDGNIYQEAIQEVQCFIIQQCFERFKEKVEGLIPVEVQRELTPAQARLKKVLMKAHGAEEEKEGKSNKGVYDYYLNQGSDIGPSAFLCAEIENMLPTSDSEGFLNAAGLVTRPVRDWWNFVVINQ